MAKGAIEILNIVLLTGLLFGVVAAVFIWGEPLIRENEGMAVLHSSEIFITGMTKSIDGIVSHPGKITVKVPSSPSSQIEILMMFDSLSRTLSLEIASTAGTIYSTGVSIPLGKNACSLNKGIAGQDEPRTVCVRSERVGENYITTYTLKFIQLDTENVKSYKTDLTGRTSLGGEGHAVILENRGTKTEMMDGKEVLKTKIGVEIL